MLRAHHLLFDGVSGSVFLEEICQLYQALKQNEKPVFVEENFELFVQQNHELSDRQESLAFWQDKCRSLEALSFDSLERKTSQAYEQKQLVINTDSTALLRKYCRRQGLTPAIFFKCLYAVLIQEYCRCDANFHLLEYHHGRDRKFQNSYGVYYQQSPFIVDQDLFGVDESLQQHL
jgi:hypothetical protein